MTATTVATLLEQFVKEFDLGIAGAVTQENDDSTIEDSVNLGGPRQAGAIPRLSPVRITAGDLVGQSSFVTAYNPPAATITVSPPFTGSNPGDGGEEYVLVRADVADHVDRLIEALQRGLRRHCRIWNMTPHTVVPDGAMLAVEAETYWTRSGGGAVSYETLAQPQLAARRVLQLEAAVDNEYADSNAIPAVAGDTWDVVTAIRAVAAADTTIFRVWDLTDGSAIQVNYSAGTGTTTGPAWSLQCGSFVVPDGCRELAFRLEGNDAGTHQMAPVIARPRGTRRFVSGPQLQTVQRIGNLHTMRLPSGVYVSPSQLQLEDVELGYQTQELGYGVGFDFEAEPPFPLYYDELLAFELVEPASVPV